MKSGDFVLSTFEGDTATPKTTYVLEITSVDPGTSFFSCRQVDADKQFTFQFSTNTSGPWNGQDDQGADCSIDTHDVYTAGGTDPTAPGVAVVTFADDKRYLCRVESISPQVNVTFYHQPFQMSFNNNEIGASDWDAYAVGDHISAMEAYVPDTNAAPEATASDSGTFDDGWWSLAKRTPAFAARIGGDIEPFAVVVHTTDMVPDSWNGLVQRWTTEKGLGDCAHFLIGRDATAGVLQLAPITKNANHAGGIGHGSFVAGSQSWHPNTVSVGIEVHCTGAVRQVDGAWRLVEDGAPQGSAIPDDDVISDPARPGRGWHKVTDYQYEQLGALLDGLESVLAELPAGCVARSLEQPPKYGLFATGRRVGHVSLHAAQRGDPWPPTCDWMRKRG